MHSEILSVQICVDVVFVPMLMHKFTEAKLNIFLVFIPENGSTFHTGSDFTHICKYDRYTIYNEIASLSTLLVFIFLKMGLMHYFFYHIFSILRIWYKWVTLFDVVPPEKDIM